jgi:cell division protein FtsQ
MVLLLILVVFLYVFSGKRNNARSISKPNVSFLGEDNLFITNAAVSKLLIQNQQVVKKLSKETLDLNTLETALNSNPMIKSAEVYVAVDGTLSAEIKQKRPVARVSINASYYIDDDGKFMPLSLNYTARVPMVTGYVEKNKLETVFKVASKIELDDFLKQHVVEINQNKDKNITLKLRKCKFDVFLGSLNALDKKINNLKAFYKKSLKEGTLEQYTKVNLQFDNQVVCTKI